MKEILPAIGATLLAATLIVVSIIIWATKLERQHQQHLNHRLWCNQHGGIYVKEYGGDWACVKIEK